MMMLECQNDSCPESVPEPGCPFQKEIFWQGLIPVTLFPFCCKKGCSWGRRF